ncbi:hypothetical protein Dimus_039000 [Dionaea muscipula]
MGSTGEILEELLSVEAELHDVQDQIKILLDQQEKLYQRQSALKALLEEEESQASGCQQSEGSSAAKENWSGSFEWDSRADDIRFNIFGISSYRANQREVMGLEALGIPAYMLTSTTSKEDEKFIYKTLEKGEGELKVLYVTPEKISKSKRFMSKLEKCHHAGRLSLIAIDVSVLIAHTFLLFVLNFH